MADLSNILGRIENLSTQKVDKTLALQVYGKSGTGKTTLATGLASYIAGPEGQVLFVDAREGWVSLKNTPQFITNVQRIQFQGFEDLGAIALAKKQGQLPTLKVVVLDEFSVMAGDLLDALWRKDIGAKPGEIPDAAVDPRLYKPVADTCAKVVSLFLEQKVHIILVSHDREVVDHRKVKVTQPGYAPSVNMGIQRLLHVNAHLTQKITGRGESTTYTQQVQSRPTDLVDAKSRIGSLPLFSEPAVFTQAVYDWVNDSSTGAVVKVDATVATDPLPEEGVPVSEDAAEDDEPVMATL